ncbi:MAG: ribonuclease III [Lachnospiraceae bacterium]|nr:ribonuclease III [Lachnospiraceae bacterium]
MDKSVTGLFPEAQEIGEDGKTVPETILKAAAEAFSLPELDPGSCSPLTLAYIGDAVFELAVRTVVVREMNGRLKDMNRKAIGAVSARAQSEMVAMMEPLLTEEEQAVYRRGRNANSPTMAKHASVLEYRRATGLEALMGYLYLKGENGRIAELIRAGWPETAEKAGKKDEPEKGTGGAD